MATEVLSTNNMQEEASADFTIAAGDSIALILKDAERGAIVSVQGKVAANKYTEIGLLSFWSPQSAISAPGVYRCVRRQGVCGVAYA